MQEVKNIISQYIIHVQVEYFYYLFKSMIFQVKFLVNQSLVTDEVPWSRSQGHLDLYEGNEQTLMAAGTSAMVKTSYSI